jgi:hypothetical protein
MSERIIILFYPQHPVARGLVSRVGASFDRCIFVAHDEASLHASRGLTLELGHRALTVSVLDLRDGPLARHQRQLLAALPSTAAVSLVALTPESAFHDAAPDRALFECWMRIAAARPNVRCVVLSTLRICGDRRGLFTEYDLDVGQRFACPEARVAFERERALQSLSSERAHVVIRAGELFAPGTAGPLSELAQLVERLRRPGLVWLAADARVRVARTCLRELQDLLARALTRSTARGVYHAIATHAPKPLEQWLAEPSGAPVRSRRVYLPPALYRLRLWLAVLSAGLVRLVRCSAGLREVLRCGAEFDAYRATRLLAVSRAPAASTQIKCSDRGVLIAASGTGRGRPQLARNPAIKTSQSEH